MKCQMHRMYSLALEVEISSWHLPVPALLKGCLLAGNDLDPLQHLRPLTYSRTYSAWVQNADLIVHSEGLRKTTFLASRLWQTGRSTQASPHLLSGLSAMHSDIETLTGTKKCSCDKIFNAYLPRLTRLGSLWQINSWSPWPHSFDKRRLCKKSELLWFARQTSR